MSAERRAVYIGELTKRALCGIRSMAEQRGAWLEKARGLGVEA